MREGEFWFTVRKTFLCKRRLDLESDHFETIWIEVKINNTTVVLGTIYRPPNSSERFWEHFEFSIDKAFETTNNVIVTGDINVNLLCSLNRHPLKDILIKFNLTTQSVNQHV